MATANDFPQHHIPSDFMLVDNSLPKDWQNACLVGRVWRPDIGPCVVVLDNHGDIYDITHIYPTMSALTASPNPATSVSKALHHGDGKKIASLADILKHTPLVNRHGDYPYLLAPIDTHAVKAAGVTFPISMIERVIEEAAKGDNSKATTIRTQINQLIGGSLKDLVPGSDEAMQLKEKLIDLGVWSQYLEVGIGPDAEIFTKAQPMSSLGHGDTAGINPLSNWNNPEPEVVLVIAPNGRIIGATLGNDVNLRDFEGRSALLLSEAKDNNGSCVIGPMIRLFDDGFTVDQLRRLHVTMEVHGNDGFTLTGESSLTEIARDITDLAAQLTAHHQYPDGAVLFTGTMFAPTKDRDAKGQGFTHKYGDRVTISADLLGSLTHMVDSSDNIPPWNFGISKLIANLAQRDMPLEKLDNIGD